MKTILLIGDSIRMGYAPFVKRALENEAMFWEPEENGGTSRNVLAHLDDWVLSRAADIVHLNCGLHDLVHDSGAAGPRIAIEEYETNLRAIFERILANGKAPAWATTTPICEEHHNSREPNSRKEYCRYEADIEKYNQVATRVASELGLPIDDLHRVVQEAGADRVLLPDGVHYTSEGSAILGQAVARFLRKML